MTLNDRVEALFKAHPGTWLDGRRIAEVGGVYGWRSRVSNVRNQQGMTIENRVRKVTDSGNPAHTWTISEYRYLPPQEPHQQDVLETPCPSPSITSASS